MEEKKDLKTTIQKTKTVSVETKKGGTYSYRYTELSDINDYIEAIGETYYQYIDRIDGDDYIVTVRQKNGVDSTPRRGCRVVQASLENSNSNAAQEQGSALTYARRYSLLMAYGLATEDDDAQSLSRTKEEVKITTKEEAEQYVLPFGKKHKGKTLGEIFVEDYEYLEWLLNGEKTDEIIRKAIQMLFGEENKDLNVKELKATAKQIETLLGLISEEELPEMLKFFKVKEIEDITMKQASATISKRLKEREKK